MGAAPFEFKKAASLVEVTDYRATTLAQLLTGVTLVSLDSIFFHLHQRLLREPHVLAPFPNDFATWADGPLGDGVVAERLANVNLFRSPDLEHVRREISMILAEHLQGGNGSRSVIPEQSFIFCQPRFMVLPAGTPASTPQQFVEVLGRVESDAIGFHLFLPKVLRTTPENDFAQWFRSLGYDGLATQLDAFDPYLNSLEDNRAYLLELVTAAIDDGGGSARA